jgi:hypothetical protein
MEREPVTSSNISSVGYEPASQVLEVEFTNGSVYSYEGVPPEVHRGLVDAPSVGSAFHSMIRDQYTYTKMGG